MKVLLTSHGSTGDIYPVIALGVELIKRGHTVTFATAPLYEPEIIRAGLRYVYLPPNWDQDKFADAMRELTKARTNIETLQIVYRHSLPFIDEITEILVHEIEHADVIVSSYIFPHYRILADRLNKPFAILTFSHNVVPSEEMPPHPLVKIPVPEGTIRRYWSKLNWTVANRVVDRAVNRVVGKELIKIGMPKVKDWVKQPAELAMISVSKAIFERNNHYPEIFKYVGYLRWQSSSRTDMLERVISFCGGDKVPVLTFGSVTFRRKEEFINRFLENWPRDKKIIIQRGWLDIEVPDSYENICLIGSMSHDDLLQYASMMIHHGGAGTTSSALHAGIPQIIIPHIGDQFFWAREIRRIEVGKRLRRRFWPERLPTRVKQIENSEEMQSRARAVAAILKEENGAAQAAITLENFVDRSQQRAVIV